MNISIFGLGYVGTVALGCLAGNGHTVIGVDTLPTKVEFINQGKSPIVEKDTNEIIASQRTAGRISATSKADDAVKNTDVSFICVGTPSTPNGHLYLDGVMKVAEDIGRGLIGKETFHTVAIRSTVLPGTNAEVTEHIAAASGKKPGVDFAVVSNPEFLREGSAVKDFHNPPFTLLGSCNETALKAMREVYEGINAPVVETDVGVAEIIKYVNNSFHALKVVFANEVGSICRTNGIDARQLMDIFCMDKKLNISPYYLKPGFAYGGSCLPKDLKALNALAHDNYLNCPVISSIDSSNESLKDMVLQQIIDFGKRNVGILGLSFKAGTDDLRNSPIIDVLEKLLGKGYSVKIYDKNVHLSKLVGANRDFILDRIPLISHFVTDNADDVIEFADVVVIVNGDSEFRSLLPRLRQGTIVYDLVNLGVDKEVEHVEYHGISW